MTLPSAQLGQGASRFGENRKRNTATNINSKQYLTGVLGSAQSAISGGGLPTLDPAAVANYYAQLQTLQSQLTNQLAALKSQRVGLKGDAASMKADVRTEGRGAVLEGINASLERGMVGSSADLGDRAAGRAAVTEGVTNVNRQLYDALAQNRLQEAGAALGYEQGTQQLASTAISQRMTLQAQETQNALAIQAAQMQAQAAATSSAAQMQMARASLASTRQQAQAMRTMANNPTPPITLQDLYKMYPQLAPPGFGPSNNNDGVGKRVLGVNVGLEG